MTKNNLLAGTVLVMLSFAAVAGADEYHYNNILVGDRASGMAGAYTAVSDDPAGMYYNPAGIAYSSGRNLSASVNAFHVLEKTYKGVIAGRDWKRDSSSLLPNFFGILQPVGKFKLGFSYAVPDSNQEDQDQAFSRSDLFGGVTSTHVINFNNKNDTNLFGPTIAGQLSDNLSLGVTLYIHKRNTEAILNQSAQSDDKAKFVWLNAYQESDEWGVRPVVGLMWAPMEKLSLGFSAARTYVISTDVMSQSTAVTNDPALAFERSNGELVKSNDKRKYPYQLSAGFALFATPSLLVSGDVSYFTSFDYTFLGRTVERDAVVNGALGLEYYLTQNWALRGGVYTDFANTPKVVQGGSNQAEHIDMYGGTLSLSHFTRNTSITAGGNYKYGSGTSQVTGGVDPIQDAKAQSWTVFVSSSYSY
jgi:long-chain fatty acid transport protein